MHVYISLYVPLYFGVIIGDQVAVYSELGYRNAVCGVDFHPFDHFVAFCSYGPSQPVKVYKYDYQGQTITLFPFYFMRSKSDALCRWKGLCAV